MSTITDQAPTLPAVALDPETRRKLVKTSQTAVRSTQERDELIAQAYREGASMREIARLVGMTHPGVRSILIRDGIVEPGRGDG